MTIIGVECATNSFSSTLMRHDIFLFNERFYVEKHKHNKYNSISFRMDQY